MLYKVPNEERGELPLGYGHLECFLQTNGLKVVISGAIVFEGMVSKYENCQVDPPFLMRYML